MRRHMPKSVDKQVFRHTAYKSKKINVDPCIYRGGIRL